METQQGTWSSSLQLTKQLALRQWKPLLFILIAGSVLTLWIEDTLANKLLPGEESIRWALQLSLGIWDLFEGVFLFLVLSWGIAHLRNLNRAVYEPHPFAQPYLTSFLAEYLRLLARVLLWGLLFILPGMYRYCKLMFVPYIALFSRHYRADQVDAIELSDQLTKKPFWLIVAVFVITTVLQIGVEFLPHLLPSLHIPPVRVAFMTLGLLIGVWTYSYIFLLFEKALEEHKWT